MPLNERVKNAYYFSVLDLRDKIFINDVKIKEEIVEVRTQFLGYKNHPFRKIIMLKSINL